MVTILTGKIRKQHLYKYLVMYVIKRKLKLNKREVFQMHGNRGFKGFVYNYGLELLKASWDFEE